MIFGILAENPKHDHRVALTPAGSQALVGCGHRVFIEKGAGEASHFSDEKYAAVGADVVYTRDEVFGRSSVLLKIASPTEEDCQSLVESQTLFSFLHLAIAPTRILETLLRQRICTVAYELIEDANGDAPILQIMGEIAGQMTTHVAARFLESAANGRGIVVGGITGIPPATIVIIGAGTVGQAAARMALGAGAEVIVLDKDLGRLRTLQNLFSRRVVTAVANDYNIAKAIRFADVLIGAILVKGARSPRIVTEAMVKSMKPGSIVIDVSIDQGGCVETSRPTTLDDPVYVVHDVIHYCVPNMPASVARTASYGLTNASLPYLLEVARQGIESAIHDDPGLARGVCTYRGACTRPEIARRFEIDAYDLHNLVG